MADYAGAVAAIKARLAANWTATPIAYANEGEPTRDDGSGNRVSALRDEDGNSVPWVFAEITCTDSVIVGAGEPGNQVWLYDGLIMLHVFVPTGTGADTAFQHAVALGEIFRGRGFYNDTPGHIVRTWSPRVDGGGDGSDDGMWFRVTATIPFEYWHRG